MAMPTALAQREQTQALEAFRARVRTDVLAAIAEHKAALRDSALSADDYNKIRRLHDDKIGKKGIAQDVGCTETEVAAALWKPAASTAYSLFKASDACSFKVAAAGVPFAQRARLTGDLWAEAKRTGASCEFEAMAIEEKHVVMELAEDWETFLAQWHESRKVARAAPASRERPAPAPAPAPKKRKSAAAPRPVTAVQARNAELKHSSETAARLRARWFAHHWEHVQPFLPPQCQDPMSEFGRKVLRHTAEQVATGKGKSAAGWRAQPCQVAEPEPLPLQSQPRSVCHAEGFTMFSYQLEGLTWMLNQHRQGVGGILGDEMGLGKTLQVISFLAALKEGGEEGPHLIVAPLSVLPTWQREFEAWCPSMKVVQFHGGEETRKQLWREVLSASSSGSPNVNVIITTYEMLIAATSMLTHRTYGYVILDEAQRIKNETTLIGQAVRRCRSVNKLLITGTPLQNDMHELWALLNFMFPDVFADSGQFDMAFTRSIGGTSIDLDLVCAAHKLLEPLMIRRLKRDVQSHLPKKTVLTIWCPLAPMQKFFYRRCLEGSGCASELMMTGPEPSAAAGGNPAAAGQVTQVHHRNKLMNLLMQLRKVCDHPYMFAEADANPTETDETIVTNSSKMMVLDRLLAQLKAEGRRVLVYSQFTSMLDIIQDYCQLVGHGFRRLDGTTCLARRKYEIKMFNSKRGEQFVYLLSTRAGALGITLTGADTVIMYDSDWNPTWDKQAHDRVHRIGQDKEVTIYTLLCKDTVEQRIFQRAAQKLSLNELVLRDETDSKSERKEDVLSQSEVKKMLRCGVMKILESESTVMTEALVDSLIADAHARGQQDNLDQGETEVEREDVDVFNQKLLEIRQFDGKKFSTARETFRSIAEDWAAELSASGAKRESVATVEQVGGYQVKKINRSAADPATTGAGENLYGKSKKKPTKSDPFCLYCGHFGMVGGSPLRPCKCGFACHRSFHEECLDAYIASTTTTAVKTVTLSGVGCTQHHCSVCAGKASGRGGLIFRCWSCPVAFCGDCLPDEFEPLDSRGEGKGSLLEQVGHLASSIEYITCSACIHGSTRKIMPPRQGGTGGLKPSAHSAAAKGTASFVGQKRPQPRFFMSSSGEQWPMQGPYMLQRVRRVVLNKNGQEVGFSDGTVMGHLPVAQADYISEFTGKPEALWRIKFDDSSMGEEDLEWVEVEDAISNYQRKAFQNAGSKSPSVCGRSAEASLAKRARLSPKQGASVSDLSQRFVEGSPAKKTSPAKAPYRSMPAVGTSAAASPGSRASPKLARASPLQRSFPPKGEKLGSPTVRRTLEHSVTGPDNPVRFSDTEVPSSGDITPGIATGTPQQTRDKKGSPLPSVAQAAMLCAAAGGVRREAAGSSRGGSPSARSSPWSAQETPARQSPSKPSGAKAALALGGEAVELGDRCDKLARV